MDKKNIILVIIVVILFAASGWVLYSGIFNKTSSVITAETPNFESNQKNIVNLLPFGDKLDFALLENRTYEGPYPYSNVDVTSEVGVEVKDLIKDIQVPSTSDSP